MGDILYVCTLYSKYIVVIYGLLYGFDGIGIWKERWNESTDKSGFSRGSGGEVGVMESGQLWACHEVRGFRFLHFSWKSEIL
jgi:hypothetical protein